MANYSVTAKSILSFDVIKDAQRVGNLTYKSWYKFNAAIVLANGLQYEIEPKGFWGTTVELKEGATLLLQFKMNWNGEIVVQTFFNGVEQGYVIKHRGLFKESFILNNQEGMELLLMKPQIKWKSFNIEYDITTTDTFETLPQKEILLMTSVHCANYYMSMMMGQ